MATSNNDRITSARLLTFATDLWAKIKSTFYAKGESIGVSDLPTISKDKLASDVQTSLGKADTALQSFTETDPTVHSWAKASSKPTYTASEVGAATSTDITNAINALDVSSVGGSGKYITTISETDGKISATAADMPTSLPFVSKNQVENSSGGSIDNAVSSNSFVILYPGNGTTASAWTCNLSSFHSYSYPTIIFCEIGGTLTITHDYNFGEGKVQNVYTRIDGDHSVTLAKGETLTLNFRKGSINAICWQGNGLFVCTSAFSKGVPASGVDGVLSVGNIPNLSASKITSGTLGTARGGTGLSKDSTKEVAIGLHNSLADWTNIVETETIAAFGSGTSAGRYTFAKLFDWIKSKMETGGVSNRARCVYDNHNGGSSSIYFKWRGGGIEKVVPNGGDTSSSSQYLISAYGDGNDGVYTYVDCSDVTVGHIGFNKNAYGSDTPVSTAKEKFKDEENGTITAYYNNSGVEYTILVSKDPTGQYGSILKWGYADKCIWILRKHSTKWYDDTWQKIDAGNADTVDGWHIDASGSLSSDENTIYLV